MDRDQGKRAGFGRGNRPSWLNGFWCQQSYSYIIEARGDACRFIASGTYRIGWIGKTLFKKKLDEGLSSIKQHMKEEGENLKHILEHSE